MAHKKAETNRYSKIKDNEIGNQTELKIKIPQSIKRSSREDKREKERQDANTLMMRQISNNKIVIKNKGILREYPLRRHLI